MIATTHLLLFLDYDGTLVPLADHPSEARLSSGTKLLLRRLASQSGVLVTLVSGRSLTDLKRLVELKDLWYVGNHGLELQAPTLRYLNPSARANQASLKQLGQRLKEALGSIPGAWVENKRLTLSVHYRRVPQEDQIRVKRALYRVVRPYTAKRQVRVTTGRCVVELRPPVRWTKGTALNWVLARQAALANGASVLPVYLGDDATDEDAFEVLKDRGVTVAVGPSSRLTQAQYYVKAPSEVQRALRLMLVARTATRLAGHAYADG